MPNLLTTFCRKAGLATVRCPVCSVLTDRQGDRLCSQCEEQLQPRMGGYCPRCGSLFGSSRDIPSICGECRHDPPPWDHLHFHGHYDGLLRELILGYKFNNGFGRTRLLSGMAIKAFSRKSMRMPDIIIPVPLHNRRLVWRGFNQSTELAKRIGKRIDRPVLDKALVRTRHTIPQTRLGMKERQDNIRNAFAADPALIKGKVALLVDDVYTTGATMRESARTLLAAGAGGVDVLVVGRAQQGSIRD